MGTFVHLNGHSEFSADSNADVRMIVKAAMNDGQKALALTDTNLAAVHGFHMEAERHGIKPIIGLDVRLVNDRFAPDKLSPAPYFDLTLLAQDRSGWHSLIALHNAALDSSGTHPLVDYALLEQHSAGLIAITGGRHCPVNTYLSSGLPAMAYESLDRLEDALGVGRVFLGASEPGQAEQLMAFFGARAVHLVATARYRQVHELDGEKREELIRLRSGWNPVRMEAAGWVKTEQEMRDLAPGSAAWQNAVTMTAKVADAITWETVPDTGHGVPAFSVPDGFPDSDSYLRHLAFRGAADRYDEIPLAVIERLNMELEGILAHRSADYVLLVEDLISWCDVQGILTSPRGTSSGSELLYCLGVTAIRPATYGLLFERLLAPGRTDLIDLDFDIQSSRRQEALDYLASRWPGRVARTSTFMKARSDSPLNGRIKAASVHPCAILISRDPLATAVPLRRIGTKGDNLPVAAWEIHALHGWGYMVLDLLGSVTLDLIAQTADAVRANPASRHRIGRLLADGDGDLYSDTTCAGWDLICSGDTDGVFMSGSDRMAKAAKAIQPRNISDMAALVALRGDETQTAKHLADRALRAQRVPPARALRAHHR